MNNSDDKGGWILLSVHSQYIDSANIVLEVIRKILPTSVEFAESSELASLKEKFCDFSLQIDLYQSNAIHWKIVISYLYTKPQIFMLTG